MGEFKSVNRERTSARAGKKGTRGQGDKGTRERSTNYHYQYQYQLPIPTTNYQCQTIEPHKRQNPLHYAV
ncbi:hypothetical protein [Chroococcidiopsis cubana]|uniref:hypothetical protein n=1 Tax=Chroococcidiopsis cubana TaxID=171392 RepID=UPI002ACE82C4|nr:hypothetical protein [Chroococcidiopsis cubana]